MADSDENIDQLAKQLGGEWVENYWEHLGEIARDSWRDVAKRALVLFAKKIDKRSPLERAIEAVDQIIEISWDWDELPWDVRDALKEVRDDLKQAKAYEDS